MRPALVVVLLCATVTVRSTATGRFYDDDALGREPETQDAAGAVARDVSLAWDILYNLFARRPRASDTRALDVNTRDEVPDSSWFVNRAGTLPLTPADVERGPDTDSGPAAGKWTSCPASPTA
jgi:hypothetical protein